MRLHNENTVAYIIQLRARPARGAATQGLKARDRWQDSDRVFAPEPRHVAIPLKCPRPCLSCRLSDENLEGQARQRTRGHNEQILAAYQLLHLTEQRAIKLMCLGEIERQGLQALGQLVHAEMLPTFTRPRRRRPLLLVQPTAK